MEDTTHNPPERPRAQPAPPPAAPSPYQRAGASPGAIPEPPRGCRPARSRSRARSAAAATSGTFRAADHRDQALNGAPPPAPLGAPPRSPARRGTWGGPHVRRPRRHGIPRRFVRSRRITSGDHRRAGHRTRAGRSQHRVLGRSGRPQGDPIDRDRRSRRLHGRWPAFRIRIGLGRGLGRGWPHRHQRPRRRRRRRKPGHLRGRQHLPGGAHRQRPIDRSGGAPNRCSRAHRDRAGLDREPRRRSAGHRRGQPPRPGRWRFIDRWRLVGLQPRSPVLRWFPAQRHAPDRRPDHVGARAGGHSSTSRGDSSGSRAPSV